MKEITLILILQFFCFLFSILIFLFIFNKERINLFSLGKIWHKIIKSKNSKGNSNKIADKIIFANNDNEKIEFKRIYDNKIKLENYIQLSAEYSNLKSFYDFKPNDNIAIKDLFSKSVATGVQLSPILLSTQNGLFTATVNPGQLTKFSDGTFSTMLQNDQGKIIGHAGFKSASANVFAPIIIFQGLALITSQYYLHGISKQLESINSKLDKLLKIHKAEVIAKIQNAIKLMENLINLKSPNIEDMVLLKLVENEIRIIFESYVIHLENIEEIKKPEKFFTSKKVNELTKKLHDSEFDFIFNVTIMSEQILYLIKIVEFILNLKICQYEPKREKRIAELYNEINEWDLNKSFTLSKGKQKLEQFYLNLIQILDEIYKDAWINEDKPHDLKRVLIERFQETSKTIDRRKEIINNGKQMINRFNEPLEVLLVMNKDSEPMILVKNQI